MKNRIVIWGTNAAEEKVLIALELQTEASKVMLYTFSEAAATAEFVTKMMNEWRDGKEVEFPEGHTAVERGLSVTESLLPEELKVERGDVIQRAQTEWHFVVLSTKLHQAYQQELAEFKEKIQQLSTYDNKLWDGLKGFWDKVQSQSRDRNLFREHADNLRDNINVLFEDLKKLRTKVQGEFAQASAAVADEFNKALDDIDGRIEAGSQRLTNVFEELKQLQQRYRTARLSNEHRNQIWDRIDGAFKKAKERKFGAGANEGSAGERHDRRLAGLVDAQKRMEDSIKRDEDELNFQQKKVNATEGQLEAQIRMAKIKMVQERIESKKVKLEEIKRTVVDIERRAGAAKNKEAKRAEKEVEKQKIEAAKETVRSEIEAGIKSRGDQPAEKEESLFEAAATVLGDVLMDAIDTAKAVASVVADKAEEAMDKAAEKGGDALDKAKAVASVVAEEAEKAFDNAP
jgi:chromosome segregation ATPase